PMILLNDVVEIANRSTMAAPAEFSSSFEGFVAKFRRIGFGRVENRADHRRESVQRSSVSRASDSAGGALVSAVSACLRARFRTAERARLTGGPQFYLALGPSVCARVEQTVSPTFENH